MSGNVQPSSAQICSLVRPWLTIPACHESLVVTVVGLPSSPAQPREACWTLWPVLGSPSPPVPIRLVAIVALLPRIACLTGRSLGRRRCQGTFSRHRLRLTRGPSLAHYRRMWPRSPVVAVVGLPSSPAQPTGCASAHICHRLILFAVVGSDSLVGSPSSPGNVRRFAVPLAIVASAVVGLPWTPCSTDRSSYGRSLWSSLVRGSGTLPRSACWYLSLVAVVAYGWFDSSAQSPRWTRLRRACSIVGPSSSPFSCCEVKSDHHWQAVTHDVLGEEWKM